MSGNTFGGTAFAGARQGAASAPPGATGNFDYNVETIAALRADVNNIYLNANPKIVIVQGYYAVNDNGGGLFRWDATSVAADDGFITIKPTANAGAGRWIAIFENQVVNIRRPGAKGDNVTDDAAAINKAIATNLTIEIPTGDFFSSGGHTLNDNQSMFGYGQQSHLRTTGALRFFTIGNKCNVFNLNFEGSGKAAGLVFQTGLLAFAKKEWSVYNCSFINFSGNAQQNGGGGMNVVAIAGSNQEGGRIDNCRFDNNNGGLCLESRGEYILVSNCVMTNNTVGTLAGSGNIYWSNCNIEINVTGIKAIAGTNVGHGGFSNCAVNHNTIALDCDSQDTGLLFTQCFFFFGAINISNSQQVKFVQCIFDSMNTTGFTLTNNILIRREHCIIGSNGTGGAIPVNIVSGERFTDLDNMNTLTPADGIITNDTAGRVYTILQNAFRMFLLSPIAGQYAIGDLSAFRNGSQLFIADQTNNVLLSSSDISGIVSALSLRSVPGGAGPVTARLDITNGANIFTSIMDAITQSYAIIFNSNKYLLLDFIGKLYALGDFDGHANGAVVQVDDAGGIFNIKNTANNLSIGINGSIGFTGTLAAAIAAGKNVVSGIIVN